MSFNIDLEISFDAVLPSEILFNENLEPNAIKLYAFVRALTKRYGYCYATNAYLGQCMKCDERTVRRLLGTLKDEKFIEIETSKDGIHWERRIYIGGDLKKCLRKDKIVPPPGQNCPPPRTNSSSIYKIDNIKIKNEDLSCPESAKPIETKEETPIKKEIPPEAREAAKKLLSKVKEIHPKFKDPKIEKWEEDMDKLNRIDKRSWDEIHLMIDWAFEDKFWVKVLMSPDGLRRNWDKMAIKQATIPNKGTVVEKNREIANEIKVYLAKIGKGNLLWIAKDYVKNMNNGDSLELSLNTEKFEEIICNWFELKRT